MRKITNLKNPHTKKYILENMEHMRKTVTKKFGTNHVRARTLTITLTENEKERFFSAVESLFQKFSAQKHRPHSSIYQFDYQCREVIGSSGDFNGA